jgi:hypothetical protein
MPPTTHGAVAHPDSPGGGTAPIHPSPSRWRWIRPKKRGFQNVTTLALERSHLEPVRRNSLDSDLTCQRLDGIEQRRRRARLREEDIASGGAGRALRFRPIEISPCLSHHPRSERGAPREPPRPMQTRLPLSPPGGRQNWRVYSLDPDSSRCLRGRVRTAGSLAASPLKLADTPHHAYVSMVVGLLNATQHDGLRFHEGADRRR